MIVTTVVRTNEHLGTAFGIFQVSSYAQRRALHYAAETLVLDIHLRSCKRPLFRKRDSFFSPETRWGGSRENWRLLSRILEKPDHNTSPSFRVESKIEGSIRLVCPAYQVYVGGRKKLSERQHFLGRDFPSPRLFSLPNSVTPPTFFLSSSSFSSLSDHVSRSRDFIASHFSSLDRVDGITGAGKWMHARCLSQRIWREIQHTVGIGIDRSFQASRTCIANRA